MELISGEETEVKTSDDCQRSFVLSSRVLVQRACNHSAVEKYRYDADGKLIAAEADITTWEERNTEIYGWLNADTPPFEPRQPINRFRREAVTTSHQTRPANDHIPPVADYEALLDKMAAQTRAVQPVKSTTVNTSKQQKDIEYNATNCPDVTLHSNVTQVDGLKRSHSEHCVTYKSSVQPSNPAEQQRTTTKTGVGAATTPGKYCGPGMATQKGRNVWSPSNQSTVISTKPGFVKPSPVGCRPTPDFGMVYNGGGGNKHNQAVPTLSSLADRQRKRCTENRMRKASGKHSISNCQQQQQYPHQQRQWRHVESVKSY